MKRTPLNINLRFLRFFLFRATFAKANVVRDTNGWFCFLSFLFAFSMSACVRAIIAKLRPLFFAALQWHRCAQIRLIAVIASLPDVVRRVNFIFVLNTRRFVIPLFLRLPPFFVLLASVFFFSLASTILFSLHCFLKRLIFRSTNWRSSPSEPLTMSSSTLPSPLDCVASLDFNCATSMRFQLLFFCIVLSSTIEFQLQMQIMSADNNNARRQSFCFFFFLLRMSKQSSRISVVNWNPLGRAI